MSRPLLWMARVMVVLAMFGLGGAAFAQTTVNLGMTSTTGLSSSVGGWTIAFAPLNAGSCVFKLANASYTNTTQSNCTGVEMVANVIGNSLSLTFEGAGGTALESAIGSSATACSGHACFTNYSDLYLNFTITAPTGMTLSSAALSLTGAATFSNGSQDLVTTDLQKITTGETSSAFASSLSTNLANNPNQVSTAFNSAVNSFSVTKDLKVTGNGGTPGATLVLNTVSQLYTAAPEPISISLFAVGLGGLAAARRRRRRRR